MRTFIIRRFLAGVLSILAATAIVFGLSRAAGDPLLLYAKPGGYGVTPEQEQALKEKLRLDRPLVIQYLLWLTDIARGDFGKTLLAEQQVTRVVGEKMGATVQLAIVSWILATIMGVPLGILSATMRGTVWDYLGRAYALVGQSLPTFWLGLMLILIFNKNLDWLPFGTRGAGGVNFFEWENLRYFVLPSFAVAWGAAAVYLRLTRSAMLEVLDSEFVKLARSKGVGQTKIVWKHAFRNALIPAVDRLITDDGGTNHRQRRCGIGIRLARSRTVGGTSSAGQRLPDLDCDRSLLRGGVRVRQLPNRRALRIDRSENPLLIRVSAI